jgi:tetratricopeptide (TPR) repeat protein
MAREPHNRLRELSERTRKCFGGKEPHQRVEAIYHRLVAAPDQAADGLVRLWREWHEAGRYEPLQALGVALQELIGTDQLAHLARAQSLVYVGLIRHGGLPLRKAEELAQEAVELFHELQDEPGEMDARAQLGDILKEKGNLVGALDEYHAFEQVAKRFTRRDPDNTDWQRQLSSAYDCVGSVSEAQGRLAEALREFEAAKQIGLRLT